MTMLHTGFGFSDLKDSYRAGKEAAGSAVKELPRHPDALLVFASSTFDHDNLLSGIRSVTADTPMAGGTTAGEISRQGLTEDSVAILALASDVLRFETASTPGIRKNAHDCISTFANSIKKNCRPDDVITLIVLPDGHEINGFQVIEDLQSEIQFPFNLVGGLSPAVLYHNGQAMSDGITGLLIHSPLQAGFYTGVGGCSGFTSIGNSMICTASEENILKEIDHEPALDFYMEILGEQRSKRLPEVCLEYPFGLIESLKGKSNETYMQIRSGIDVDFANRTITLAGPIPKGSSMTLTTCSRTDLIQAARTAAEQANANLNGCKPELVIVFSCVGRKKVLGRRTNEEIDAVREILGNDVPIIGMYTHGEIGPVTPSGQTESTVLFHNETIVVWALGSRTP